MYFVFRSVSAVEASPFLARVMVCATETQVTLCNSCGDRHATDICKTMKDFRYSPRKFTLPLRLPHSGAVQSPPVGADRDGAFRSRAGGPMHILDVQGVADRSLSGAIVRSPVDTAVLSGSADESAYSMFKPAFRRRWGHRVASNAESSNVPATVADTPGLRYEDYFLSQLSERSPPRTVIYHSIGDDDDDLDVYETLWWGQHPATAADVLFKLQQELPAERVVADIFADWNIDDVIGGDGVVHDSGCDQGRIVGLKDGDEDSVSAGGTSSFDVDVPGSVDDPHTPMSCEHIPTDDEFGVHFNSSAGETIGGDKQDESEATVYFESNATGAWLANGQAALAEARPVGDSYADTLDATPRRSRQCITDITPEKLPMPLPYACEAAGGKDGASKGAGGTPCQLSQDNTTGRDACSEFVSAPHSVCVAGRDWCPGHGQKSCSVCSSRQFTFDVQRDGTVTSCQVVESQDTISCKDIFVSKYGADAYNGLLGRMIEEQYMSRYAQRTFWRVPKRKDPG